MTDGNRTDPLIEWLFSLRGPSLKWDIDTARELSAWLGHPHRRYPCVHVAGTNGKGSVSAMIHSIAGAAGLAPGLFTSPHLVRPEERIRVGEDDIDPDRFRALIAALRHASAAALERGALPRGPSFFEMMTAAAMIAFAEAPVGLAVFETGLGGRLDATNVIHPVLSIVTTISADHLKTLGGSVKAVAREKAGVIKPGIPVLAGWIDPGPLAALEERAHMVGAPFHAAAREIRLDVRGDGSFDVETPDGRYSRLTSALSGRHQAQNAAVAVRACEITRQRGLPIATDAVRRGLSRVRWPGRLERLGSSPEVLLDAAHNVAGTTALAEALAERDARDGRPRERVLVVAVTDGRDPASLFSPLAASVDRVVVTRAATPRAQEPAQVAARLAGTGLTVEHCEDLRRALARARDLAGREGQVVVAGSLYLVGDARARLLALKGPGHVRREQVPDISPRGPAAAAAPDR